MSSGVKGVVRSGDRVLLVQQTYGDRLLWNLPGGFVQRGETVAETLVREMLEECGLEVRISFMLGVYYDVSVFRHDHNVVFVCEVEDFARDPLSMEIARFAFFPMHRLPPLRDGVQR